MITRSFSFLALLYLLGYALFAVLLPRPADDRATDAIVVLTGGAKRIERGLDARARGGQRCWFRRPARRAADPASRYNIRQRRCCSMRIASAGVGRHPLQPRSLPLANGAAPQPAAGPTIRLLPAPLELSRRLGTRSRWSATRREQPLFRQLVTEITNRRGGGGRVASDGAVRSALQPVFYGPPVLRSRLRRFAFGRTAVRCVVCAWVALPAGAPPGLGIRAGSEGSRSDGDGRASTSRCSSVDRVVLLTSPSGDKRELQEFSPVGAP